VDTKDRIVDAALQTLREEGLAGASARAIARTGGFNQALIFYHYGSIEQALLAGVDRLSADRLERYEQRLAEVTTLAGLVAVARQLHAEDRQQGHLVVLSQLLAGSMAKTELRREVRARFEPWITLVRDAVHRVLAGTPFAEVVPEREVAVAVTALFLGLELLTRLEGEGDDAPVFDAISGLAGLATAVLGGEL
jgi:AcrR family transcriptional regulator